MLLKLTFLCESSKAGLNEAFLIAFWIFATKEKTKKEKETLIFKEKRKGNPPTS